MTTNQLGEICKVGIVGAGAMAREHISAFKDVPGVEVVGIANRTVEKAHALADEFGIATVCASVDELYEECSADIVQVSVYETAINSIVKECFQHPWGVFMEKPVGLNLIDAQDIHAEAQKRGSSVWVGLNRRTMSSTMAVLEDLAEDPTPRYIHVQDQQSLETARAIGHDDEVVKNWMYANSIHLVDYLLSMGRGKVVKVQQLMPWDCENPKVVLAMVSFSSGDIGVYECIWNGPGPWACQVTTERRRWEMRPLEKAVFQNVGERTLNSVKVHSWDEKFKPGFRFQAEQVIKAWRGEQTSQATLDDAMRAMSLVQDIYGV